MGNSFLYMLIDFKFLHLGSQSVWIPYVLVAVTLVQIPVFLGAAVHSHCKMRKYFADEIKKKIGDNGVFFDMVLTLLHV